MSNEQGVKEKKYRFAKDNLLPFFLKQFTKGQTSILEKNSVVEKMADMRIFPYITADGIQYGRLNEPGISWYYCDDQLEEDVRSTESYRIFASLEYSTDLFLQLRMIFGTEGSGHIKKYSDQVVFEDLIRKMSKEKKYTDTWWNYASDAFDRWNPKTNPGSSYEHATKGIQEAYFLYDDKTIPSEYQDLLYRFGIYKDIRRTAGYQSYIGKNKGGLTEEQDKIRFLKYLGVPTSFIERGSFGISYLASPVQALLESIDKIVYPVSKTDGKKYDRCSLAEYLILHVVYEEDRYFFTKLIKDGDTARKIPVLNIKGQYERSNNCLFYLGSYEKSDVPDNPLNYMLLDKGYDVELQQQIAYEIESVARYEDYSLSHVTKPMFYKWVWQFSKNENLIQNILLCFDEMKRISLSDSTFAFDVLDNACTRETDATGNETIIFKKRDYPSPLTFTICATVEKIIQYRKHLNALFNNKGYRVYITLADDDFEKAESWIEAVKNRIAAASPEHYSRIVNDPMWKNIYVVNYSGKESDTFGQYIAIHYLSVKRVLQDNMILVVKNSNIDSYVIALCNYIKDYMGITLSGVTTNWNEQYKTLVDGIRDFLMEKKPIITDDKISFSISDMADVNSLEDEIVTWKQMEENRDRILRNRVTEASFENWKEFLDSKYHGRCQLCGNRTVSGVDRAHTWTFRMVKQRYNALANMEPNMFCLCPSCHGEISYGFKGRDLTQVLKIADEYAEQMRECIEENPADPEDSPSIISEYADVRNEHEGFRKPVICDVLVNGVERQMKFSWEHFIRIAFLLTDIGES